MSKKKYMRKRKLLFVENFGKIEVLPDLQLSTVDSKYSQYLYLVLFLLGKYYLFLILYYIVVIYQPFAFFYFAYQKDLINIEAL